MHTSPEIYHTPQKAFIISTYPYLCYSNSRLNSPQGNVNQVTFGGLFRGTSWSIYCEAPRCHWQLDKLKQPNPKIKFIRLPMVVGSTFRSILTAQSTGEWSTTMRGRKRNYHLAPIQLLHWLKLANVGMKPRKYMPMVKIPVKSRKLKILRKTFPKEELLPQSPPSGTTQKFQAGLPATLIMSTEHSKIMCFPTLETDPLVKSNLLNFSQFFSVSKAEEPAS